MASTSTRLLSVLLLCFLLTAVSGKSKLKTKQDCFTPNPNNFEIRYSWTLSAGQGWFLFKTLGKEFYIRLYHSNLSSFAYTLVVGGGWNNNWTKLLGPNGEVICEVNQSFNK